MNKFKKAKQKNGNITYKNSEGRKVSFDEFPDDWGLFLSFAVETL